MNAAQKFEVYGPYECPGHGSTCYNVTLILADGTRCTPSLHASLAQALERVSGAGLYAILP